MPRLGVRNRPSQRWNWVSTKKFSVWVQHLRKHNPKIAMAQITHSHLQSEDGYKRPNNFDRILFHFWTFHHRNTNPFNTAFVTFLYVLLEISSLPHNYGDIIDVRNLMLMSLLFFMVTKVMMLYLSSFDLLPVSTFVCINVALFRLLQYCLLHVKHGLTNIVKHNTFSHQPVTFAVMRKPPICFTKCMSLRWYHVSTFVYFCA